MLNDNHRDFNRVRIGRDYTLYSAVNVDIPRLEVGGRGRGGSGVGGSSLVSGQLCSLQQQQDVITSYLTHPAYPLSLW